MERNRQRLETDADVVSARRLGQPAGSNPTDGTFTQRVSARDLFPGFAAVPYPQHPYQCWLQQSGE